MDLGDLQTLEHPDLDESLRRALLDRVADAIKDLPQSAGLIVNAAAGPEPIRSWILNELVSRAKKSELWRCAFLLASWSDAPGIAMLRAGANIPCQSGDFARIDAYTGGDLSAWADPLGEQKFLGFLTGPTQWVRKALAAGAVRSGDHTWRGIVEKRCRAGDALLPAEAEALAALALPADTSPLWPYLTPSASANLLRRCGEDSPSADSLVSSVPTRCLISVQRIQCEDETILDLALTSSHAVFALPKAVRFLSWTTDPIVPRDHFHVGGLTTDLKSCDSGRNLTCLASDGLVRIWSPQGDRLRALRGHDAVIIFSEPQPDGPLILTGSQDQTARIWDTRTGRCRAVLHRGSENVVRGAWSPDGQYCAILALDGAISTWRAADGAFVASHTFCGPDELAWGPAGLAVVADQRLHLLAPDLTVTHTADLSGRGGHIVATGSTYLVECRGETHFLEVRSSTLAKIAEHPLGTANIRSIRLRPTAHEAVVLTDDGVCHRIATDGDWRQTLPGPYVAVAVADGSDMLGLFGRDHVLDLQRPLFDLLATTGPSHWPPYLRESLQEALAVCTPHDLERHWLTHCARQLEEADRCS